LTIGYIAYGHWTDKTLRKISQTKKEIEDKEFDLKAVNNNAPDFSDKRTTTDLYSIITDTQNEIQKALSELMK
jgi:hypothetical protein